MSNLFKIDVNFPEAEEEGPCPIVNTIKLTFLVPHVYFAGHYYDYLTAKKDFNYHKKAEVRHAIGGFIDMIEKEIRLALPKDLL